MVKIKSMLMHQPLETPSTSITTSKKKEKLINTKFEDLPFLFKDYLRRRKVPDDHYKQYILMMDDKELKRLIKETKKPAPMEFMPSVQKKLDMIKASETAQGTPTKYLK